MVPVRRADIPASGCADRGDVHSGPGGRGPGGGDFGAPVGGDPVDALGTRVAFAAQHIGS